MVPYVLQDGYTINLTVIPSETVFDGYDDAPTNINLSTVTNHTVALHPHTFVREYVTSRNLYDGQTMLIYETQPRPVSFKDPDFTQPITNMYQSGKASHLLVLTTVSIVDSAGKQVHADEEMPFAQDRIPPQPAPTGQAAPLDLPSLPAGGVKGGFDGPSRETSGGGRFSPAGTGSPP